MSAVELHELSLDEAPILSALVEPNGGEAPDP